MSIDFTKAEIGQEVSHPAFGDGVITRIDIEDVYPILVKFGTEKNSFTKKGKHVYSDKYPTLCVGHGVAKIDQGELPKSMEEPKPLEWKGEFVWAYVGNDYESAIERGKRHVIGFIEETEAFISVNHGDPFTKVTGNASIYNYAWEIEDD